MLRYKALQIIGTFSQEEVKKFAIFLDSPYFNTSKKVAQLYGILTKYQNKEVIKHLDNELIMKELNTSKISTLKNLMADLELLLIKFLAQIGLEKDWRYSYEYITSELEKRNLDNILAHTIKKIENRIYSPSEFDNYVFWIMMLLTEKQYNSQAKKISLNSIRKYETVFALQKQLSNYMTYYFLIATVKDYTNQKWQEDNFSNLTNDSFYNITLLNNPFTNLIFENLIKTCGNSKFKSIMKIYYKLYLLFANKKKKPDQLIVSLVTELKAITYYLSSYEKHYLYSTIHNLFNKLESPDNNMIMNFYKEFLKNNAYKLDNEDKLPLHWTKVIIEFGFMTGKPEFSEFVLGEYSNNMIADEKRIIACYYDIRLDIYHNRFSSAIENLNKLKTAYFFFKIDYYLMMIYCSANLEKNFEVERNLIVFKKFLINNKKLISKSKLDEYIFIIDIWKKIFDKKFKEKKLLIEDIKNKKFERAYYWTQDFLVKKFVNS